MNRAIKRTGERVVGLGAVASAMRRLAAARGRSLVLVYHRVAHEVDASDAVTPCIPAPLLRRHVEVLAEVGEIVPLARLLRPASRAGPVRFALTFDDDYRSHVDYVLPTLLDLGVPATFFLSGRALRGLGPYWWEALEDLLAAHGPDTAARALGLAPAPPAALALACEADPSRQALLENDLGPTGRHLDAEALTQLRHHLATVGFHTLRHPVLTRLASPDLDQALAEGRNELAEHVGQPLELFAHPHGKADERVAAATRRAGYRAAFTGRAEPLRRGDDPHLLGRWEAGPVDVDTLLIRASWRLQRRARDDAG